MPPDDRPGQVTQETSDIVNAVLRAHLSDDRMTVALEIIGSAMLVVDGDATMQASLAWFLRRCAARLDRDATDAATLQ